MAYQVLARKWRPKNLSELVGQESTKRILANSLEHGNVHQAYLFTGTRGIGKTTIARILAKCLNCATNGISANPCCKCQTCLDIDAGIFNDLIEIDGASRTSVEDTKELIESAQFAPSIGEYKVYLIDEVHMLSNSSFNALLKTLEEPPAHCRFILATTDPQKIPATIVSRTLQFSMRNLLPEQIVEQLRKVLQAEQITFDEQSLWLIAHAAEGSMRDALTICEQAIAYTASKLNSQELSEMLGVVGSEATLQILQLVQNQDAEKLFEVTAALAQTPFEHKKFINDLLSLIHRAAICQVSGKATSNSRYDRQTIAKIANSSSPEELQIYWQIALNGQKDLSIAHNPMIALEMLLLRMIAFKPSGDLPKASYVRVPIDEDEPDSEAADKPDNSTDDKDDASASPSEPEAPPTPEPETPQPPAAPPTEPEAPAPTPETEPPKTAAPEPTEPEPTDPPAAPEPPEPTAPAEPPQPTPPAPEAPAETPSQRRRLKPHQVVDDHQAWQDALNRVALPPLLVEALEQCQVQSVEGGQLELVSADRVATNQLSPHLESIDQALSQLFRQTIMTRVSLKRRKKTSSDQAEERLGSMLGFQVLDPQQSHSS